MTNTPGNTTVLVTGGTGFVGIHCIVQLLQQGYTVKTTIRTLKNKEKVTRMLINNGITVFDKLSFIEADLTSDINWDKAVAGCTYVLHVASPIGIPNPKSDDDFIKPAVDGTLRVLKAAKNAGVKRVVLTSSFGAVGYTYTNAHKPITEENWTDLNDKTLSGYLRSKTLAEMAAWDFIKGEGKGLELTVINPAGIFGPTPGPDLSGGLQIICRLLDGAIKATPNISFGIVDVRDVADLHLRAMVNPKANGERFLALADEVLKFHDIAILLRNKLGDRAKNVTTKVMPDWLMRVLALFKPSFKDIVAQLGRNKNASNEKAKKLLGWTPRSHEEAILASAESLFRFGLIKK
jgi:dihydroflavonol-4-reductase